MEPQEKNSERVAFGGGCFWCTEAVFLVLKGVQAVTPGYAGGSFPHPTYEQVSTGTTGHAEVILIEYDPAIISFETLLTVFFESHDPTSMNRQGNDVGTQYRSIILYTSEAQHEAAERKIKELASSGKYGQTIVTQLVHLDVFYPAEEYHTQYYAHHPDDGYSTYIIKPKVEKVKKNFCELLKEKG